MSKVVRILSLDGGGMRGIIEAEFLRRLMLEPLFTGSSIGESFDIIAGTSIGGIQALGYASGLGPQDFIDLFRNDGPLIFTTDPNTPGTVATTQDKFNYLFKNNKESLYPNTVLKQKIQDKIGANKKMQELQTNVLITTWDQVSETPEIVSNIELPNLYHSSDEVWKVALATGAAPMFLPAQEIGGVAHIDGGVFMNNPSDIAYSVAKSLYPLADKICVLSLGTGQKNPDFFPPAESGVWDMTKNASSWITGISFTGIREVASLITKAIAGTQEAVHKSMEFKASSPVDNLYYYRFQPEFTHETDSEMDISTPEYLDDLIAHTSTKYAQDAFKIQTFLSHMEG